jgi:hypothetical protein
MWVSGTISTYPQPELAGNCEVWNERSNYPQVHRQWIWFGT